MTAQLLTKALQMHQQCIGDDPVVNYYLKFKFTAEDALLSQWPINAFPRENVDFDRNNFPILFHSSQFEQQYDMHCYKLDHSAYKQSNHQLDYKSSLPTLPIIPIRQQHTPQEIPSKHQPQPQPPSQYSSTNEENVIPGYNFQSLFRKKSHIRMARKKNKEELHKKNSNIKLQASDRQEKTTRRGHWTLQENKLYHWFLEIHSQHFVQKHLRRTDKIFKSMANFIRTREAEQCRSHHQKMQKKYHNFYQILLKLRMDSYNSVSPDLLKLQLEQNNYKIHSLNLISDQQLKSGEAIKRQSTLQQNSKEHSAYSHEEQHNSSKQEHSLFAENYENQLTFKFQYS